MAWTSLKSNEVVCSTIVHGLNGVIFGDLLLDAINKIACTVTWIMKDQCS